MKKKIISIIFTILFILTGIVSWKYSIYKKSLNEQPAYFDLFIAHSLFEKDEEYPWIHFWSTAWNKVSIKESRTVQWIFNKRDFEKLDSIYLGIKNTTNEKFYYVTWGEPNSRIRESFVVYRDGEADSIPFGGFGCGTGIYISPLKNGETAGSKFLNPLLFNPFTGYPLPLKNKNFPGLFKEIYGDSVAIKFEQATYSLPWNTFPSQMIASEEIVVNTETFIENWKKGNYKLRAEFYKEDENAFYVKNKGDANPFLIIKE